MISLTNETIHSLESKRQDLLIELSQILPGCLALYNHKHHILIMDSLIATDISNVCLAIGSFYKCNGDDSHLSKLVSIQKWFAEVAR